MDGHSLDRKPSLGLLAQFRYHSSWFLIGLGWLTVPSSLLPCSHYTMNTHMNPAVMWAAALIVQHIVVLSMVLILQLFKSMKTETGPNK